MRVLRLLILMLASVVIGHAQTTDPTITIRSGVADPASCNTTGPNIFFRTDTGQLKVCTAANTWTVFGISAPGGSNTQILYNNNGAFGGVSGVTTNGTTLTIGQALTWTAGVKQTFGPNATNSGINIGSNSADPSSLANGDIWYESTRNLLRARINGASVSLGVVSLGRVTAQTAVTASIATYTVGSVDASFQVSANVLVTASATHSFSIDVTYTDEGNTARTLTLPVAQLAGSFVASGLITNVTGAGPYESAVVHIRCKAATAITIRTSAGGTYTSVTYNAEGAIKQIS